MLDRALVRRNTRPGWALAACLLAAACGGGGGGDAGGGSAAPSAPTPPTAEVVTRDLLESCVLAEVAAYEAALAELCGLDGTDPAAPTASVTGIDLVGASVSWAVDADGDGTDDATGTTRFLDGAGAPTLPVTPTVLLAILAGDDVDLAAILAALPDGTTVATDFVATGAPVGVTGSLEVVFVGGRAASVSGDAAFDGATCDATVSFADLPLDSLLDPAPTGSFAIVVDAAGEALVGTVTLNGDGTATIDATVDGVTTSWTYDLASGTLTLLP